MNLPLGIDLELTPQVYRIRLRAGDLLCLYTDGLTEQESEAGDELGEESVMREVCQRWQTPEAVPDALMKHLAEHQGTIPRLDDVTWLQLQAR
jgi:serine phosphatase RsbU (regulator of sigma subunit)